MLAFGGSARSSYLICVGSLAIVPKLVYMGINGGVGRDTIAACSPAISNDASRSTHQVKSKLLMRLYTSRLLAPRSKI